MDFAHDARLPFVLRPRFSTTFLDRPTTSVARNRRLLSAAASKATSSTARDLRHKENESDRS
jgi:hypothetical protein